MAKPTYVFAIDRIRVDVHKGSARHDSDWLFLSWLVNGQAFGKPPLHLGGDIDNGNTIEGPFATDPIAVGNDDAVVVVYVIVNLSALDTADQGEKAVEFAGHLVSTLAPVYLEVAGALLGSIAGGLASPALAAALGKLGEKFGLALGNAVASAIQKIVVPFVKDVVGAVVEFVEGPNCDGEVLRSNHVYPAGLLRREAHRPPLELPFTGPQTNSDCRRPPQTRVTFSVRSGARLETLPYSSNFVQSTAGRQGDYALLVPRGGRLEHIRRANNTPGFPWIADAVLVNPTAAQFMPGLGPLAPTGASLIQGNFGDPNDALADAPRPGNLEAVARISPTLGGNEGGDFLVAYFQEPDAAVQWHGPFPMHVNGRPITDVTGRPALIQGTHGTQGNFEMLVPQGARLVHYFRENDRQGLPWRDGGELPRGTTAGTGPQGATHFAPTAVALIQSNFNEPGNLEAVVRMSPAVDLAGEGDHLAFYFRDGALQWRGPTLITVEGRPVGGVTSNPAFIQGTFGDRGNFELLVAQGDRLVHYFRDNDAQGLPWHRVADLPLPGPGGGLPTHRPAGVSMFQGNFKSNPTDREQRCNLEAIVWMVPVLPETSGPDFLAFYFRDVAAGAWKGPFPITLGNQRLSGLTGF